MPDGPNVGHQKIETNEAKVRSIKHRSMIMKKNYKSHLNAANIKSTKESSAKTKQKNFNLHTGNELVKDLSAII